MMRSYLFVDHLSFFLRKVFGFLILLVDYLGNGYTFSHSALQELPAC